MEIIKYKITPDHIRSFQGVTNRIESYIDMRPQWQAQQIELDLSYSYSELLDEHASHITIYMNDEPVKSLRLDELAGRKGRLTIPLATDRLKLGNNKITIGMHTLLIDGKPCVDDQVIGNWFTIQPETEVILGYSEEQTQTIGEFVNRMIFKDGGKVFGISDNQWEAEVAFGLNSSIGEQVELVPTQVLEQGNRHFVEVVTGKDNQLIYDASQNQLYGIVSDQTGYDKLAKMLSYHDQLAIELNTQNYTLRENVVINEAVEVPLTQKMSENGVVFKGPFHHEQTFFINNPKNRIVAEGSDICLKFKYSDNLHFDKALLSVWVNDVPVGSKKLTAEGANGDELTLYIPGDKQFSGPISVKVGIDLEMKDTWCEVREAYMPWAYIDPESTITLRTNTQKNAYLEHYPYPFVEDYMLEKLTFVLPDHGGKEAYEQVAQLWNNLKGQVKGSVSPVRVVSGVSDQEGLVGRNLIVIGTAADNTLIKHYLLEGNIPAVEGLIKIVPNPYDPAYHMMLITAATSKQVTNAITFMTNPLTRWKLRGDQIYIKQNEVIEASYIQQEQIVGKIDSYKPPVERTGLIVLFGTLMLMVCLTLILVIRKNKR